MFAPRMLSQEVANIVANQVWEAIGETWMPTLFLDHSPTAKPSEENRYGLEI
jgi:hypothetical protein